MGGFGSNATRQAAQSEGASGLRGTAYEGQAAASGYGAGQQMSGVLNRAFNRVHESPEQYYEFGKQLLPGGRYGLGSNADSGVNEYGRDMFSRTSADMGSRGFVSPEAQGGVIGSAIQRSLPSLIPQQQAFQLAQFQAPQNLVQTAGSAADYWARLLGSRQTGSSTGSSNGFNFSIVNS
jgi:hypothetical protein